MNSNKLIAIVSFSFSLMSATVWAHHNPGHDVNASGGVGALAEALELEVSSRITEDNALQAAIDSEAAARTAADQALANDTAAAQADASDAQNRVSALEWKMTLSDVGACNAGEVAKSNGAGGWTCAPNGSGGTQTDTMAALGCTNDGDIAVFFGGQWVCESDLPAPPRFVDNGDGTVTDNQTGLMWEKKLSDTDAACLDPDQSRRDAHCVQNQYSWTAPVPFSTAPNGTLYTDFLANLNLGVTFDPAASCFANHCDWRAPNIQELQTILLASCPGFPTPCIDETIFGPTQALGYWSSSTFAGTHDLAWRIVFSSGIALSDSKSGVNHARAVRNGQ